MKFQNVALALLAGQKKAAFLNHFWNALCSHGSEFNGAKVRFTEGRYLTRSGTRMGAQRVCSYYVHECIFHIPIPRASWCCCGAYCAYCLFSMVLVRFVGDDPMYNTPNKKRKLWQLFCNEPVFFIYGYSLNSFYDSGGMRQEAGYDPRSWLIWWVFCCGACAYTIRDKIEIWA